MICLRFNGLHTGTILACWILACGDVAFRNRVYDDRKQRHYMVMRPVALQGRDTFSLSVACGDDDEMRD